MWKFITASSLLASCPVFAQTDPGLYILRGAQVTVTGNADTSQTSAELILDGDLNISSGGVLVAEESPIIRIGGDIIYGDSIPFVAAESTIILDGAAAQVISNTGFSPDWQVYNLIVNNSSGFTINTTGDADLDVVNILEVQDGAIATNGNLIIESSAPDTYGRIAYTAVANPFIGDVIVTKTLTNTNGAWRQFSLPLNSSMQNANWTDITFNYAGHSTSQAINVYSWDPSENGVTGFANGWYAMANTDGTGVVANSATPFTVYLDGTEPVLMVSSQFSCAGTPFQGNVNNALQNFRDPADTILSEPNSVGWNFIANPYPALINLDALLNSADFTSGYKAAHIYNTLNDSYDALLANGVTKLSYNTTGSDLSAITTNIPPFQGFWVKATAAGQICNLIEQDVRTTDYKDNMVFTKTSFDLARFNLISTDSLGDQLVVYFLSEGSRNFDLENDGYYLSPQSGETPVFYGREGRSKASIISRAPSSVDSVLVSYKSKSTLGEFFFNPDFSHLDPSWNVYLKDRVKNKYYELKDNENYTFENKSTYPEERFVVYFSKKSEPFDHLVNGNPPEMVAFARNGSVVLQSLGVTGPVEVMVYDMAGGLVIHEKYVVSPADEFEIKMRLSKSVVLVKLLYGGKQEVIKMYL